MMRSAEIKEYTYYGQPAVMLIAGNYEATLLPDVGGNLVSFKDNERHLDFLRTPTATEMPSFESKSYVYGIPVLFPPNRYEDGVFKFDGNEHQFPVNETVTNNHAHGFVHNVPWQVVQKDIINGEMAAVILELRVDRAHSIYTYFPYHFTIRLHYGLSTDGLHQKVEVMNEGQNSMPCLLAFHTTVNVPFSKESSEEHYTFQATIGERWELSERRLPTGNKLGLSKDEEMICQGGISPFFEEIDKHYTAAPQSGANFMRLTDHRLNLSLVYKVGMGFRNWVIWNGSANGRFFCPEPQTSVINAPNLALPAAESGLITLQPGQCWSEISCFYIEEGRNST